MMRTTAMSIHPITCMSTAAFAEAKRDHDVWMVSSQRVEWLKKERQ